jgi:hypothetical protein
MCPGGGAWVPPKQGSAREPKRQPSETDIRRARQLNKTALDQWALMPRRPPKKIQVFVYRLPRTNGPGAAAFPISYWPSGFRRSSPEFLFTGVLW